MQDVITGKVHEVPGYASAVEFVFYVDGHIHRFNPGAFLETQSTLSLSPLNLERAYLLSISRTICGLLTDDCLILNSSRICNPVRAVHQSALADNDLVLHTNMADFAFARDGRRT